MKKLSKFLMRLRLSFSGEMQKSKVYAKYLHVTFGKNVRITGKISFGSEPYLITIGDDVTLTNGVTFHTHDGGVGVLRKKHPGINIIEPIIVGSNVFIGTNSTILPGVSIGNNVIIGASSLVTRNVPDDVVVAGVPAKVIKSVQDYEKKALEKAIYLRETEPMKRKDQILSMIKLSISNSSANQKPSP